MAKYIIKKGRHYSNFSFLRWLKFSYNKKYFDYSISMSDTTYWDEPRNNDDYDKNKVCGLGFGFNHHKNSIRIAWVPDFGKKIKVIKLFAYLYDEEQAQHQSYYITDVKINSNNKFEFSACINIRNSEIYYIRINNSEIRIKNTNKDSNLIFTLNPYVGGNNTAINDMKFDIEREAFE